MPRPLTQKYCCYLAKCSVANVNWLHQELLSKFGSKSPCRGTSKSNEDSYCLNFQKQNSAVFAHGEAFEVEVDWARSDDATSGDGDFGLAQPCGEWSEQTDGGAHLTNQFIRCDVSQFASLELPYAWLGIFDL